MILLLGMEKRMEEGDLCVINDRLSTFFLGAPLRGKPA